MSKENDEIRAFRQEYLDYVEGLRPAPPSLDTLSDAIRRAAEQWVMSLNAARGIDPYASRPSAADLLSRARASDQAPSDDDVEGILRASLLDDVDPGAVVVRDVASVGAGLVSRLLVQARGIRLRVIIEPSGTDIDSVYGHRIGELAAVFGAFPDTSAALLMTSEPELVGTVVDRDDVVAAIETPSGERRPPRIRRPITDAVAACRQFFAEAIPTFEPFVYPARSSTGQMTDVVDSDRVATAAVEQVVAAGRRARLEAKSVAWSAIGALEATGLAALLQDAKRGSLTEAEYRRRLDEVVDAA